MTSIIACVNLKGGVGKTALAVNLAAHCGSSRKMKALLVDLDPQTNATFCCMTIEAWEAHAAANGTIADLLVQRYSSAEGKERSADEVIVKDVFPNVDLVPSHLKLFTIDLDLGGATGRERKLKIGLGKVIDNYDIVICDCPPNLTIPTQNALVLSTHYLVPVSPDFLSALGVGLLLQRVKEFSRDTEHPLSLAGIVISRYGRPARHRDAQVGTLRATFGNDVLDTVINERVTVSEAAEQQQPLCLYSATSPAAEEFGDACEEILGRMGL